MEDQDFKFLCGFILASMVCFGLIGNIISLITWKIGKRCKNFPGAMYLSALALSDSLVLCSAGFKYALELITNVNIWDFNEFFCKLFHTLWHFLFLLSTWIVVSVTIERTIAICHPMKLNKRTNKTREIVVVVSLMVVFLLVNLPFTVGAKLMARNNFMRVDNFSAGFMNTSLNNSNDTTLLNADPLVEEWTCQADPLSFYYQFDNVYHNWFIDFGLLFSLPVSILGVCNVLLVLTLFRRTATIQRLQEQKTETTSHAMTARILALCLVQCVSVGPYSIASLIPGVLSENKAVNTIRDIDRLQIVLSLIWYINNSVNFILYSLFGTAFRRDCVAILLHLRPYQHTIGKSRPVRESSLGCM